MAHDLNALYEVLVTTNPDTLASHGVEIYVLPESERNRWRQAIQPWVDEQWAKIGDAAEEFQKIADDINARYPYIGYIE